MHNQLWIDRYDTLAEAQRYLRSIGEPDYIISKRSNKVLHKEEALVSARKRYAATHNERGIPYQDTKEFIAMREA